MLSETANTANDVVVQESVEKNVARLLLKEGDSFVTAGTAFLVEVDDAAPLVITARHCVVVEVVETEQKAAGKPRGRILDDLYAFGRRLQYVGSRAFDDVAVFQFVDDTSDSSSPMPKGLLLDNQSRERREGAVLGAQVYTLGYPEVFDYAIYLWP